MCAATLEWFLWISAFIYCLYKVYVKADHWSIKVLAAVMAVAFTALRYVWALSYPFLSVPCVAGRKLN